jgi:hypothetical protein
LRRARPDHTLQTTALVHEIYLRLEKQHAPQFQNRDHFVAVFDATDFERLKQFF